MPACVAHMLIARKVRDRLTAETVPVGFVKMLNDNTRYMELGSLGPDLPYYAIRGRSWTAKGSGGDAQGDSRPGGPRGRVRESGGRRAKVGVDEAWPGGGDRAGRA